MDVSKRSCFYETASIFEENWIERNTVNALRSQATGAGRGILVQMEELTVIALEGNGARPSHQGGGYSEEGKMFTLNTIERHAVCFPVESIGHDLRSTQFSRGGVLRHFDSK